MHLLLSGYGLVTYTYIQHSGWLVIDSNIVVILTLILINVLSTDADTIIPNPAIKYKANTEETPPPFYTKETTYQIVLNKTDKQTNRQQAGRQIKQKQQKQQKNSAVRSLPVLNTPDRALQRSVNVRVEERPQHTPHHTSPRPNCRHRYRLHLLRVSPRQRLARLLVESLLLADVHGRYRLS